MLKKTIEYEDFNGNKRKEDFYFNLSKSELVAMDVRTAGGLQAYLQKIVDSQDGKTIMDTFEKIIMDSYGEKSLDGKRFVKSKELSEAFRQTGAYDTLFMELVTDADAGAKFVNGIVPAEAQANPEGSIPAPVNIKH